ncbi:MAG: isocitrate lyase/phosphoenolpyruvate mutase family protein [Thermoanaerobaculia bacterium]
MPTQLEKSAAFRALHYRSTAFVIPNPWDVGSARLLAGLGFEALATTSAGYAFSVGKRDNTVGRDEIIRHVRAIVESTDLPVSADLENGFGDDPRDVAETIRQGMEAGLAGGSIEDATARTADPLYSLAHAAERVRAAAETAHAGSIPFTLTARAENHLVGNPDLGDTIRRLQAYQEAGADVLYAPGLTGRDEIAELVRSVDRPVNVLLGLAGMKLSVADLEALGVRRVSVGSALARAAFGAFLRAARELRDRGTADFLDDEMGLAGLSAMFDPPVGTDRR